MVRALAVGGSGKRDELQAGRFRTGHALGRVGRGSALPLPSPPPGLSSSAPSSCQTQNTSNLAAQALAPGPSQPRALARLSPAIPGDQNPPAAPMPRPPLVPAFAPSTPSASNPSAHHTQPPPPSCPSIPFILTSSPLSSRSLSNPACLTVLRSLITHAGFPLLPLPPPPSPACFRHRPTAIFVHV